MSDVTIIDDVRAIGEPRYIQWGPVIGGAIAAAALGLVLGAFAAGIGLSVSSTAPTWRDSSFGLVVLTGLYFVFTAVLSYGLGGYVTGRASCPVEATPDEREFRDGLNGLASWALATLMTAIIAFGTAQVTVHLGAQSQPTAANGTNWVAGENTMAFELDRLFRTDQRVEGDLSYPRAEAARILLTANGHSGMEAQDHDYLTRLVTRRTGLAAAAATSRVDQVVAETRDNIARARKTTVILAFMAGAAALLGVVVAWVAAGAGGRHREGLEVSHLWRWGHMPGSAPSKRI